MTDMPTIKMMAVVTSSRMMPPTTVETAATMVVKDPPVPATMAGVVYVGVYVAAARLPLTQKNTLLCLFRCIHLVYTDQQTYHEYTTFGVYLYTYLY